MHSQVQINVNLSLPDITFVLKSLTLNVAHCNYNDMNWNWIFFFKQISVLREPHIVFIFSNIHVLKVSQNNQEKFITRETLVLIKKIVICCYTKGNMSELNSNIPRAK